MKGSNDSMMLRGADAPALGVEERSDEAPRAGGAVAPRAEIRGRTEVVPNFRTAL